MPRANLENAEATYDRADAIWLSKMEKRWNDADEMIGELVRDGKTINYVWPEGGRYREGHRATLIDYLICNNHA